MKAPKSVRSLRLWLTAALFCIIALPPAAVWAAHAVSATTSRPDATAAAAARDFAIGNIARWTDPAWRSQARAYFAAHQVDAELRPAHGPWLTTLAIPPSGVEPADKFVVQDPSAPNGVLGSGWITPHTTTRTTWTLPLTAGALALVLTVAATGAFLGRHVVRPLAAMSRATTALGRGQYDMRAPATRVREVAAVGKALTKMAGDLDAARHEQAEMEEHRRQFIGAIAHDLRTPLFTLRAYLDGLSEGLATTPQKTERYLRACRTSAATLDQLISDLFTYARMEFLDQRPDTAPIDLKDLLDAAVLAHRPRADTKQVTLTLTAPDGACILDADQHLLARAIDNLLDNALRYTPDGGHIRLDAACTADEVTFSVTDTGPGIAPEDLPHLFTPLYRGDTSRNRATGGAGLGLAIAQRIIHAHRGTLTATNSSPTGARFTARLRTRPPTSPDMARGPSTA